MEEGRFFEETSNEEEGGISSSFPEGQKDALEAKKNQLLKELENGLLLKNNQFICQVIDESYLVLSRKIRVSENPTETVSRDEEEKPRTENQNRDRRRYSREEMEILRFVKVKEQKKKWREAFSNLEPSVSKGYNDLATSKHQKRSNKALHDYSEEEGENSDEDYSSIQRPAFAVEGEPDFESGPPEDGMEYLRRVRWEAATIPNVKVVKMKETNTSNLQTPYMPQIAEIPYCAEHLLPMKEWEEEFLIDFEYLREMLAREEGEEGELGYKERGKVCGEVKVSAITEMDSVARVSQLRKRIEEVEGRGRMDREDCGWLLALCAAVDTPLHADTCAAMRSLYRKCATLRAGKTEVDDELVMLNLLVTISGKYFGQSER